MTAQTIAAIAAESQSIEAVAEWYARRLEGFEAEARAMRAAQQRLDAYVREYGPLETSTGRLEILSAGYDYDAVAIAEAFPAVARHREVTLRFRSVETAERALSLVFEEASDTELVSTTTAIDKSACARMEKAGGKAGERMRELRRPKGRLGVSR